MELGTGRKALWAITCAKAGAKKVYAIEANKKSYDSSFAVVKSEGLENVHLIHGFSDEVELPERCDVLVHDLLGDIASSEGMVPFIEDARQRFLTPDAIHIPQRCTTHVVLVEDPKLSLADRALGYVVRGFQRFEELTFVRYFGFPHTAWLTEPAVFEDIEFRQAPRLSTKSQIAMEIKRDGELRGVLFFIRLTFSEKHVVDTWASQTSWATPYIRLKDNTPVKKGDVVEVSIDTELSGNPRYALKLQHRVNGTATEIGGYAWSGD